MPVPSRRQLPPGIRRAPAGIRQTSTATRQPSTGVRVLESVPVDGLFNMVEQTTPSGEKIQYLAPMQTTTGRIVNSFGQIVPAFRRPILISGPTGCLPGSFDARMCNFQGDIVSVDKKDLKVACNGSPHHQLTSSIPSKKAIKSNPPVDLGDRSYGNDANAIASSSATKIKPRKVKRTIKSSNPTSMLLRLECDKESKGKGKAPVRGQGKCTCKV